MDHLKSPSIKAYFSTSALYYTHPGREILRLSGPRKVWSEIEGSHFGRGGKTWHGKVRSRLSDLESPADFEALALVQYGYPVIHSIRLDRDLYLHCEQQILWTYVKEFGTRRKDSSYLDKKIARGNLEKQKTNVSGIGWSKSRNAERRDGMFHARAGKSFFSLACFK